MNLCTPAKSQQPKANSLLTGVSSQNPPDGGHAAPTAQSNPIASNRHSQATPYHRTSQNPSHSGTN
ncbi:MAG: hypothetical protein ACNA7V_10240 [Bacteroidales bacterium]